MALEALDLLGDSDLYLEARLKVQLLQDFQLVNKLDTATEDSIRARVEMLATTREYADVAAELQYATAWATSSAHPLDAAVQFQRAHRRLDHAGRSGLAAEAMAYGGGQFILAGLLDEASRTLDDAWGYAREHHSELAVRLIVERRAAIALLRQTSMPSTRQ